MIGSPYHPFPNSNLNRSNREDGSDFDNFWTKSITSTRSFRKFSWRRKHFRVVVVVVVVVIAVVVVVVVVRKIIPWGKVFGITVTYVVQRLAAKDQIEAGLVLLAQAEAFGFPSPNGTVGRCTYVHTPLILIAT